MGEGIRVEKVMGFFQRLVFLSTILSCWSGVSKRLKFENGSHSLFTYFLSLFIFYYLLFSSRVTTFLNVCNNFLSQPPHAPFHANTVITLILKMYMLLSN